MGYIGLPVLKTARDLALGAGLRAVSDHLSDRRRTFQRLAASSSRATAALDAAGAVLDERRDMTRRRQAVIAANPSLLQREQIKYASLAVDLAKRLRGRGVELSSALLAADVGVAVFRAAFEH